MSVRAELLAIVEKQDVGAVVQFLKNAKSQKRDLSDALAECSQRQNEDLWENLRGICTRLLLDDVDDNEQEEAGKKRRGEQCAFLDGVVTLATAAIQQKDVALPVALLDTAGLLHGVLLALPEEMSGVKGRLAALFEAWWRGKVDGRQDLIENTLLFYLTRSLDQSTASDVRSVWRLHEVLPLIDFGVAGATELKNLLGRCCCSAHYLKADEGRRFLGYAMSLNCDLVHWMHAAIKSQMPHAPKSWLPHLGEVYFRAWQRSSDDVLQKLERDCIQDLMKHAIHASREGPQPMSATLFKILHHFHGLKKQRGVDTMLLQLYNPILWRSLSVPNSDVRANSAALLLDVFPLRDPTANAQEADALVQKQFDFIQRLLTDPCPEVRAMTVQGVCCILRDFLEMIPGAVVHALLCRLLKDLAWDTSSPPVRLAVVKGVTGMLDNPMCHVLLKPLLPGLAMCLHDKTEAVRLALLMLLTKVKACRSIKYWQISPVEQLLQRLETDSQAVIQKVVALLHPSFLPLQQPAQEQLSRCLTLLESNPLAARVFFLNAPRHMTLDDTVRYISLLCRYLMESVRSMSQRLNDSDAEPAPSTKTAAKTSAKTRKDKRSRTAKNQEAAAEEDEEDDDEDDEDEEDEGAGLSPEMLQGLLEAVFLMWTAVSKQLDSAENAELKQSLLERLSHAVPAVLKVAQDPKVVSLVVEIAGHLPPKAVPTISRGCLSKLRTLGEEREEGDYMELLEAMCLWKMAPQVLQLLSDWLEDSLTPHRASPEPAPKKQDKAGGPKRVQIQVPEEVKRPRRALDYLAAMLRSPVCKRVLVDHHRPLLAKLNTLLSRCLVIIEKRLGEESTAANGEPGASDTPTDTPSLEETAFCLHLRLSALLHDPDEGSLDCASRMREVLVWGQDALVPLLEDTVATETKASSAAKKGRQEAKEGSTAKLAESCVMVTLNMCSNMLMLGIGDGDMMTHLVSFCQAALSNAHSLALVDEVLSCLLQLLLFVELKAGGAVVKCMSHAMVAANACLARPHSSHTKLVTSLKSKVVAVTTAVLGRQTSGEEEDVAMATELMSTLLAAVLAELTHASKQELLPLTLEDKADTLPPISTCVLTCLTRSKHTTRVFVDEAEGCVRSGAVSDVHTAHALAHLLLALHSKGSYHRDVDLGPLLTAALTMTQQMQAQAPDTSPSDTTHCRDVMETIQTKLQTLVNKSS